MAESLCAKGTIPKNANTEVEEDGNENIEKQESTLKQKEHGGLAKYWACILTMKEANN